MKWKLLIFTFILTSVALSSFAMAANCPPVGPPKIYRGDISVGNNTLLGSFALHATIDGERVGEANFTSGKYSIQVAPCSGETGDILFSVHGVEANEKGYYFGTSDEWGEKIDFNLTLNSIPPTDSTCNNPVNSIDLGEECDGINLAGRSVTACGEGYEGTISCSNSCVIDYSNCTLIPPSNPNNGGGSGGSSGGSGGGSSGGGGGGAPANNLVTISDNSTSNSSSGSGSSNSDNSTETFEESSEGKPFFNFLSGNAIADFSKTNKGKGTIVAVILVAVGLIYFFGNRKKSMKVNGSETLPIKE